MAAGSKVLEYIIGAKDATGNAIKSATSKLKEFAARVAKNLANIQAGFQMAGQAVRAAISFMSRSFEFEKMTVQFKTLIGDMDQAREHMQMLKEMGNTPPFSLEEFAKASRSLMVMTDNALGFKKSLELVGDAAAATGQPIETLAHEVGRAYAIIRDGQPLTRATMALRNMGVITPDVAANLDELQKAGATNMEIWTEFETALKKYNGAMAETEETGNGLVGAIKSQWDSTVRELGDAFMETAKDGLGELLKWFRELNDNGSIEEFAQSAAKSLGTVGKAAKWVADTFGELWNHLMEGKEFWESEAKAAEKAADAIEWTLEGEERINPYTVKRKFKGSDGSEKFEYEEDVAEKRKFERAQREAKRIEDEKKRAEQERQRIADQMEEAQKKADAKRAEELRKAEEEAAKKRADEEAKLRAKEEAERQRIEEKLARERQRLLEKEMNQRMKAQTELQRQAQSDLAEAQNKVREAWGWYRDKDSLKAQINEEKAEAAAQKQFENDFAKLKDRRRDWRTADNLSLDDEAVRRVGLAREAEAAAQQRLDEIAENTRDLADKIEELLTMEE
ncbi:MAG: hypothetical protein ACI4Q3_00610 [Kiritimatiellia bacterium]